MPLGRFHIAIAEKKKKNVSSCAAEAYYCKSFCVCMQLISDFLENELNEILKKIFHFIFTLESKSLWFIDAIISFSGKTWKLVATEI